MGRGGLAKNFVTPVTQEFSKNIIVSNLCRFSFQNMSCFSTSFQNMLRLSTIIFKQDVSIFFCSF